jgi:hypothetical protein
MKFVLPMRWDFRRGTRWPRGDCNSMSASSNPTAPISSIPRPEAFGAGIKARDAGQISAAEFGRIGDAAVAVGARSL